MEDLKKVSADLNLTISHLNQRYPFCLVWTPLPLISHILPFIGHVGICTSDGVIHDFGGSHYIALDDMTFGRPYKYIRLFTDSA